MRVWVVGVVGKAGKTKTHTKHITFHVSPPIFTVVHPMWGEWSPKWKARWAVAYHLMLKPYLFPSSVGSFLLVWTVWLLFLLTTVLGMMGPIIRGHAIDAVIARDEEKFMVAFRNKMLVMLFHRAFLELRYALMERVRGRTFAEYAPRVLHVGLEGSLDAVGFQKRSEVTGLVQGGVESGYSMLSSLVLTLVPAAAEAGFAIWSNANALGVSSAWMLPVGMGLYVVVILVTAPMQHSRAKVLHRKSVWLRAVGADLFEAHGLISACGGAFDATRLFRTATEAVVDARLSKHNVGQVSAVIQRLIVVCTTGVCVGLASLKALRGEMTVGELNALWSQVDRAFGPLTRMRYAIQSVDSAWVSLCSLADFLALSPSSNSTSSIFQTSEFQPPPLDDEVIPAEVRLENVKFAYKKHPERNQKGEGEEKKEKEEGGKAGVSGESKRGEEEEGGEEEGEFGKVVLDVERLRIGAGEKVVVVGKSGSGKSTLASLLVGLRTPQEGRVLLNDVEVSTLSSEERSSIASLIPQAPPLLATSVAENVALGTGGSEGKLGAIEEALRQAAVFDDIQALPEGVLTSIGRGGTSLSGGQGQRLAIARGFLKPTPLQVFDEPLVSLDKPTATQIAKNIFMNPSNNSTTILVSHDVKTVAPLADRVIVMHKGEIHAHGTHTTLLETSALYRSLVRGQEEEEEGEEGGEERGGGEGVRG